jgi:hypothetical protein
MKRDLCKNKSKITFNQVPTALKNLTGPDKYYITSMKETSEENNCKIFLNTYQSSQFYYIPETTFDMHGNGDTGVLIKVNAKIIEEVEIYAVELKVYEKVNRDIPAYIGMMLDDDYLIIELV